MIRMKKMIAVSLALLLIFVISACSGSNPSGGDGSSSPKPSEKPSSSPQPTVDNTKRDPVKLKMVWWGPAGDQNWKRMFDAFEAKYPWIKLEILQMKGGVIEGVGQMVTESIAAGDPIDVFWNNSFDYVVKQNLAEDLTPYIQKDAEFKSYPFKKGYLENFQSNGKQLGLAHGNDAFLMFVNKDLLKQYGMEMPSVDWTWKDFREMAKKATNPAAKHYGISYNPATQFFWWTYTLMGIPYANGSAPTMGYFNKDFTKSLADGSVPKVLDDLNFFNQIMKEDGSMLNAKRAKEAGLEKVDTWASGQSLFHVFVSPGIDGFKKNLKFNWDILPMPKGTERQVNFSWINPWFMSKGSKHKEEAWLFMKWWETNKDAQKLLYDIGGTFPNTEDAEMVNAFNSTKLYEGLNKDALVRALKTAGYDPTQTIVGGQEYLKLWNGFTAKGGEEEVSAYDYFPAAAQQFNQKMAEILKK